MRSPPAYSMHQELAVLAGDLHRLQADVAADAVLFVHHGRTGRERRAGRAGWRPDRAGCAAGAAPAARGGRTARRRPAAAAADRRRRGRPRPWRWSARPWPRNRGRPASRPRCSATMPAPRSSSCSISRRPGRIGADQHPARILAPAIRPAARAAPRRARRASVVAAAGIAGAPPALPSSHARRAARCARSVSSGGEVQLGRCEHRMLDVVRQVLVARGDALPDLLRGGPAVPRPAPAPHRAADSRTGWRWLRRTAADRTRCRPARCFCFTPR